MPDFIKVATTSELANNQCKRVQVNNQPVALFNLDGHYYAIHDTCTHAEASLCEGSIAGDEILCPLHFASFNIRTGQCTSPPADEDVRTYQVRVDGNDILVAE